MAKQELFRRLPAVSVPPGEDAPVEAGFLFGRNQGNGCQSRASRQNRKGFIPQYHLLAAHGIRTKKGLGCVGVQNAALCPGNGIRPQQASVSINRHNRHLCRLPGVRAGQALPLQDGIEAKADALRFFRLLGRKLRRLSGRNGRFQLQKNPAAPLLRQRGKGKGKGRCAEQRGQYKKKSSHSTRTRLPLSTARSPPMITCRSPMSPASSAAVVSFLSSTVTEVLAALSCFPKTVSTSSSVST